MSLFVEVQSVDKGCPVIINLDHIIEIAPLTSGGCALYMMDSAGVNSRSTMQVKDSYNMFKQFAMQTVTPEDIQNRIDKMRAGNPLVKVSPADKPAEKTKSKQAPLDIPKL
jgi:hypothetical protein